VTVHHLRVPAFVVGVLLSGVGVQAQTTPSDLLAEARRLYNERQYDAAAKLADQARAHPDTADAAAVVYARARLEESRGATDPGPAIDDARQALRGVTASGLARRDRVEFNIALGQALYLDDQFSLGGRYAAAAAQFELALASADALDARSRDRLFEWWALSLDRQAHQGPESERRAVYSRILDRAERELALSEESTSAAYWLAAAARGVDDLPRALGTATAAWIRAGAMGAEGARLRGDLDRLVIDVLLPERARQLAPKIDPKPALSFLLGQWDETKRRWAGSPSPSTDQ
jgi:hypothetical protein